MNKIKTNLNALETMLFIWSSLRDKEKVSDVMLADLASSEEMKASLEEEFDENSIRKVLSAISNREMMNAPTKKESRFWNYNMWMLEDADMTELMLAPVKTLNLDHLVDVYGDIAHDEVEVVFFPGHMTEYAIIDNKLYINFFKLQSDFTGMTDDITIDGLSVLDYVTEKLKEMK